MAGSKIFMTNYIILFLVLLNPFALFTYLQPIMKELRPKTFLKVFFEASLISFAIYYLFALTGFYLFEHIFQIHFEAFRIFGGIVIVSFALLFIVQGKKSFVTIKGDLDGLASEIALPFMVGAATIALSILIGERFSSMQSLFILSAVLIINFIFIATLLYIRLNLRRKLQIAFDKSMDTLLRLNGFFVGAIGLDMIVVGLAGLASAGNASPLLTYFHSLTLLITTSI
ncbi:MarC family protein [soil metagenome]